MSLDATPASPTGEATESGLEKVWHRLVETFAALGTVLIGVLMLIICADIVARNAMGASLPLVSEGGALLVVTLVALQLAATVRAGRMARTEVFIVPFTDRFPKAGAVLEGIYDLTGAVVLGIIAWASIRVIEKDIAAAEFIGVPGEFLIKFRAFSQQFKPRIVAVIATPRKLPRRSTSR